MTFPLTCSDRVVGIIRETAYLATAAKRTRRPALRDTRMRNGAPADRPGQVLVPVSPWR